MKGQIEKTEAIQTIASLSAVKSTEGLSSYEIAALVLIVENRLTPDALVSPHEIQRDMRRAGYTDVAISLSLESLRRKGMIDFDESRTDDFGNRFTILVITQQGLDWLLDNKERFRLTVEKETVQKGPEISDADIPF